MPGQNNFTPKQALCFASLAIPFFALSLSTGITTDVGKKAASAGVAFAAVGLGVAGYIKATSYIGKWCRKENNNINKPLSSLPDIEEGISKVMATPTENGNNKPFTVYRQ